MPISCDSRRSATRPLSWKLHGTAIRQSPPLLVSAFVTRARIRRGVYENCCHGPGHRPGRRRVWRERATDHRCGGHISGAGLHQMGRGSEGRGRYRAQLSGDRLRRRTEPDPQPDGGLRRLRCADGPGQAHRGQAAAIPHRDGRRRRHREPARHQAQRDQAHRRDPGRHLRRHHHEMERSQAGRTQSRREAAEPGDRSGASRRRLRHHLRVHLLSLGGQSRSGRARSAPTPA